MSETYVFSLLSIKRDIDVLARQIGTKIGSGSLDDEMAAQI